MRGSLRIVTVAGAAELEARFAARLAGRQDVESLMRCVDKVELLAAIRGGGIDAAVIVGAPAWLDPMILDEAVSSNVMMLGLPGDPLDAEELTQLGIGLMDEEEDLRSALARGGERSSRRDAAGPPGSGEVIAVWGPKGAPGRTTVAIELAYAFSRRDKDVLLAEADPYGGDAVQLLGIAEDLPTIVWCARLAETKQLEATGLAHGLRRTGPDGPVLLPGLPRAELWSDVSPSGWGAALELFRSNFEAIFVDVGPGLGAPDVGARARDRDDVGMRTLGVADRVVAVVRADPVGIKHLLRSAARLAELVDLDRVVLVANRVVSGHEREVGRLLRSEFGIRPAAYIPDRPQDHFRAVLAGRSVTELDPRSEVVTAVEQVAARLGAPIAPRGLLTKLGGRG